MFPRLLIMLTFLLALFAINAQETQPYFPINYFDKVITRAGRLREKIDHHSRKALRRLMRQEQKVRENLLSVDSTKAAVLFENTGKLYADFDIGGTYYIPFLDTLGTALKFLMRHPGSVLSTKKTPEKNQHCV